MEVRIFLQPFDANGSPQSLGTLLIEELGSGRYKELIAAVAFVTSSGTTRLCPSIRKLVEDGGRASVVCGAGNGVSSRQAIQHLLQAGAEVTGAYTGASTLFHSKVFSLRGPDAGLLVVGSNNLTADGLFRHFEAATVMKLDPRVESEGLLLAQQSALIARLQREHSDNFFPIVSEDLDRLVEEEMLADEASRTPRSSAEETDPVPSSSGGSQPQPTRPSSISVPSPPPPDPSFPVNRPDPRPSGTAPTPTSASSSSATHFAMVLADFDVSHRRGVPGTPEMSLPAELEDFFGPLAHDAQNHAHAGRHFKVTLRGSAGQAEFRVWKRIGGEGGHADLRLRVNHDLIDQTAPTGGDLLHIERLALSPGGAAFRVEVVPASSPQHAKLLTKCSPSGRAGDKQYGTWS